jgi:hypothetical protein
MRSAVATVSLIYLLLVSLFLYFQAIWVCDGYFPVGWGLKGSLVHVGMWLPPGFLFVGCVMLASRFRCKLAMSLVFSAILFFTGLTLWVLITSVGLNRSHQQSSWTYLWLVAPLVAAGAAWNLSVWAKLRAAF